MNNTYIPPLLLFMGALEKIILKISASDSKFRNQMIRHLQKNASRIEYERSTKVEISTFVEITDIESVSGGTDFYKLAGRIFFYFEGKLVKPSINFVAKLWWERGKWAFGEWVRGKEELQGWESVVLKSLRDLDPEDYL